jgi:hypothetical protein
MGTWSRKRDHGTRRGSYQNFQPGFFLPSSAAGGGEGGASVFGLAAVFGVAFLATRNPVRFGPLVTSIAGPSIGATPAAGFGGSASTNTLSGSPPAAETDPTAGEISWGGVSNAGGAFSTGCSVGGGRPAGCRPAGSTAAGFGGGGVGLPWVGEGLAGAGAEGVGVGGVAAG